MSSVDLITTNEYILLTIIIFLLFSFLLKSNRKSIEKYELLRETDVIYSLIDPDKDKEISINVLIDQYRSILKANSLNKENQLFVKKTIIYLNKLVVNYNISYTIDLNTSQSLSISKYKYLTAKRVIPILNDIIKLNPNNEEERKSLFSLKRLTNESEYRKDVFKKTKDLIKAHNIYNPKLNLVILYTEPEMVEEAIIAFETKNIKIQFAGKRIDVVSPAKCYYI